MHVRPLVMQDRAGGGEGVGREGRGTGMDRGGGWRLGLLIVPEQKSKESGNSKSKLAF